MKLNESLFEDYGNEENFINYIRDNFDVSSEYIRLLYNLIPYCMEKYGFEETKDLLKETVADSIGMDEEEVDAEFVMEESLNESSNYDTRYEVRSYYDRRYRGLEDDLYTDDFEEVKDWVWEKGQQHFIEVSDRKTGKSVRLDTESYDWESDDAYRILDDLEELSPLNDDLEEGAKN